MDNQQLDLNRQKTTLVLANAGEIAARVIGRIAGEEISNTIHGESATKSKIASLVIGKIAKNIESMK